MPDATGEVRITYVDTAVALRVFEAVHPDDDDFAATRQEGSTVVAVLRGTDARSLLRSVDDFLACASVAEDVMNAPSMDRRNA